MPRLKKTVPDPKRKIRLSLRSGAAVTRFKRSSVDFVEPVRELLMRRIANEIDRRDWTQAQAAEFLGVTQPRISDLMRGLTDNFTIDALVQWSGLFGLELKIDTVRGGKSESLYAWLDHSDDAISYYTKLIASQPQHTESYWKRAYAHHQRGNFELAVGDYTRAMELDPKLQYLRINRAQSYISLGQYGAALLDCDRLIAQNPDEPELAAAYFNRGLLHRWMHNHKEAIRDFSNVLKLEPNNTQAQQNLDSIREISGDYAYYDE